MSAPAVVLSCVLVLFSLWDFYWPGLGRGLDYLGVALIAAIILVCPRLFMRRDAAVFPIAVILGTITIYALVAGLNGALGAPAATMLGAAFVFPYALFSKIPVSPLRKVLDLFLILHVTVFFLQLGLFFVFGYALDVHPLVGSINSRSLNEDLGFYRPAGLYQEPNSYCTALFILLFLRALLAENIGIIGWLVLLTFLVSQSLWGIGAVIVLIAIFGNRWQILAVMAVLAVITLAAVATTQFDQLIEASTALHRLANLESDASRQGRFGTFASYVSTEHILGHGIDTQQFQQLAANGIAFWIYTCGYIGIVALCAALISLARRNKLAVSLGVVFLLTTYPLATYMIFWFWLGVILNLSSSRWPPTKDVNEPAMSPRLVGI